MPQTLYCILFEDDASFAAMRQRHMPAHLAFLTDHRDIVAADPLTDEVNARWRLVLHAVADAPLIGAAT